MTESVGKALPPGSAFAGDDGSADPELAHALVEHAAGRGPLSAVVARLAQVRVLIPILASLDKDDYTEAGLRIDKEASAGIVALKAPDGRTALPVFTSVATMATWRADARPTPADAVRAALSAVSEDWAMLVVDPGNEAQALIPRPAVWAIAQQLEWIPTIADGQVHPEIAAEIAAVVGGIEHIVAVATEPGRSAELAVVLKIDSGLTRAGLNYVLEQVNAALAGSSLIAQRVDGLELRIGKA